MSKIDFQGDAILVTGASTGIGRAAARLLASRGARVFLVARRKAVLDEAVAEIRADGGTASYYEADIAERAQLDAAIDAAQTAFGPVHGLFANAGTGGRFAPISDYDDDQFDAVLRTNLMSPFWALKRVLPGMIARGKGSIVLTGSLASEQGMANNAAYVSSKHGVLGLARAAAIEGAAHNVRANCVIPGFIDTPMMEGIPPDVRARLAELIPQKRMGTAEEVAEVAAFLLSDAASYVTGQSWSVDGGMLGTQSVS
jgi:NAD(P)-dependent dehydrogenase (short-subunit alcohol dehydrogenase family)